MNSESKLTIVYPRETGGVSIIYPNMGCGLTVQEIAEKDVPAGVPYVFIPTEALPTDHTFFDAFEVDFSFPNGKGIGAAAWFARQQTTSEVE